MKKSTSILIKSINGLIIFLVFLAFFFPYIYHPQNIKQKYFEEFIFDVNVATIFSLYLLVSIIKKSVWGKGVEIERSKYPFSYYFLVLSFGCLGAFIYYHAMENFFKFISN